MGIQTLRNTIYYTFRISRGVTRIKQDMKLSSSKICIVVVAVLEQRTKNIDTNDCNVYYL